MRWQLKDWPLSSIAVVRTSFSNRFIVVWNVYDAFMSSLYGRFVIQAQTHFQKTGVTATIIVSNPSDLLKSLLNPIHLFMGQRTHISLKNIHLDFRIRYIAVESLS
jgi:hypothetical protein